MDSQTQNMAGASLVDQAAALFAEIPYPSIVAIERYLRPGYKAAADCMAELEALGIVSAPGEDGLRQYMGPKKDGVAGFREMARKIGAVMEPAGRWWENLPTFEQREYAKKANVRWIPWGDMDDAERRNIRYQYLSARREYERLSRQFVGLGGVAA